MESDVTNMERSLEEICQEAGMDNLPENVSNEMLDSDNSMLPSEEDMKNLDITQQMSTDTQSSSSKQVFSDMQPTSSAQVSLEMQPTSAEQVASDMQPTSSEQYEENQAFIFTCPFCFTRCKEADELKDHLTSHFEIKIVAKVEEHECDECEKAFDSLDELEVHQQVHKLKQETGEFQCTICGKYFNTKTGLANHQGVHELDKLQCGECKQYFMDEENLMKHFQKHVKEEVDEDSVSTKGEDKDAEKSKPSSTENEPIEKTPDGNYKCSFCDKLFEKRHRLVSHLRTHTGEKPFQCQTCLQSFSQKFRLQCHERIHRGERPYKCTKCDKSFTLKSGLRQHALVHTGERPYSCMHCGQKFRLRSGLSVHQSIHITTRNFKCPQCVKCFKIRRSLNRHVARVHVTGRYECKECGDSFSTKTRLTSHEFMHKWEKERDGSDNDDDGELDQGTVEKPVSIIPGKNPKKLECTYCHKLFKKPSVLMRHERVHTGEKPHKCRFCPKQCARKDGLIQHERIHTGERPFMCRYCQASYRTMSGRNDHEKSHLKCTVCRREFKTVTACESHEKTHNEGLMYKCKKCEKSFASQRYLVYHVRIHDAKSEIHECEICGEAFGLKGKLSQHKMSAHGAKSLYHGADKQSEVDVKVTHDIESNTESNTEFQEGLVKEEFNESDQASNENSDVEKTQEFTGKHKNSQETQEFTGKHKNSQEAQDDSSGDPDWMPSKNTRAQKSLNKTDNQAAKPIAKSVGKKPHKCQFCEMFFDKDCRRIMHERVHTGERPYKCSQCLRAFTRKDTLKKHQATHVDGLPFSCDICQRTFKTRENLNAHVRNLHQEKLSRFCQKCGKEFKSAEALTKHELMHSDSLVHMGNRRVYICKFCQKTFKRLRQFSKHLKKVHGELNTSKAEADLDGSDAVDDRQDDGKDPDYVPEESQDESDDKGTAKVDVKYYQCNSCVQKRTTIKGLELHERTHTNDRPYKCTNCAEEFVREEMVKVHEEHGCKTDDKKQTKLGVLIIDHDMEDVPTPFPCTLCGNLFDSESSLRYHKRSHNKKEFICPACGEKFPNKMTLKEHKKTHSMNVFRNYYCTECPKSYMQRKSLEDHIETCHKDTTRIKCEHCGETFVNQGWFKKHMFSYHHEILVAEQAMKTQTEPPVVLNQAEPSQFDPHDIAAEVQVDLHQDPHSNPDKVIHFDTLHVQSTMDCIETLAAFSSLQSDALTDVADHVGVHEDRPDMVEVPINPIKDPNHDSISNLSNDGGVYKQLGDASQSQTPEFTQTSNQLSNSNDKPVANQSVPTAEMDKEASSDPKTFICQWCPRKFGKKSQLRNHERVHTGETPFLCNQCGKGFKLLSGLKDHEDRHKGIKKYKCNECPKAYSNPSALQEHIDAHRGIKRYQCAECPKSYRQHQSLKEHMDVHRGFRKYQCDTCPRSFSQRRCWRIHMRTHGKTV